MKNCYVESYGCQMNTYDGDLVRHIMRTSGCRIVDTPEEADIILVNTCAVRQHAERRVIGRIGELNKLKLQKPERLLGVLGCMAQRRGTGLLEEAPYVDLVMGPGSYRTLPETIDLLAAERRQISVLDNGERETYAGLVPETGGKTSVMIPIMRGCSEFCTYCIVPAVRGRESNRSPEDICAEVEHAVRDGAVEVTLLGQNITAYRYGSTDLAGILDTVSRIDGLKRLRFLTSHPRHLTERMMEVMAERPNVCNNLHLPVQSGSDRILKRMARRHTVGEYLEKVRALRDTVSGISLTTDVITGFPGEQREDFLCTLALMEEVVFDDAFTYKYSMRPGTPAERLGEQVSPAEAQVRLEELIALQRRHTSQKNLPLLGKTVEVMVERGSKKGGGNFFGRTTCARNVVFDGNGTDYRPGDIVMVSITASTGPTLLGGIRAAHKTGG